MPVTIKPSPERVGRNSDRHAATAIDLMPMAPPKIYDEPEEPETNEDLNDPATYKFNPADFEPRPESRPVLHSSFLSTSYSTGCKIIPYNNGFVDGTIRAYQQDLHLVLRPDDIWLSIITQFSFYVNAHAEDLRSHFVAHQGKEKLTLKFDESFAALDIAKMARMFTCLLEEKLLDREIRNWIIPDFTTTTDNDMAVASMTMMATMQKYFDFEAHTGCGLPSVTLLGTVSDWEEILRRLDLLSKYGDEPAEWATLLRPILSRFVSTFSDPESANLKDFWMKCCYKQGAQESGQSNVYSGWLTAFMYWKVDGTCMMHGEDAWTVGGRPMYRLDGVLYPHIDQSDVPAGTVSVPVVVKAFEAGIEFQTSIVAGSVGVTVQEEGKEGDVVQPLSGWWMFEVSRKPLDVEPVSVEAL